MGGGGYQSGIVGDPSDQAGPPPTLPSPSFATLLSPLLALLYPPLLDGSAEDVEEARDSHVSGVRQYACVLIEEERR